MFCFPLPRPGQRVPGLPFCSPSPLGLSPPNPRSGEQSRGPPALDRKLSAPLARKASSLTARKAGCLPRPCSLKPNPSFQLRHERAPGPAFPGDPAACDLTAREFSLRSVPSWQRLQNKGQGEITTLSPPSQHPQSGQGDPVDRDFPSWGGLCFGKQALEEPSPDESGAVPGLPGLFPQGGSAPLLALT